MSDRPTAPPPHSLPAHEDLTYENLDKYFRTRRINTAVAVLTVIASTVFLFHPWFSGTLRGESRYFEWDVPEQYWPDLVYLCGSIHDGDLPYWNPYDRGGYPYYADPQAGTYHPANWALCLLGGPSPALFWAVARVVVSFLLAGLFALLFFRRVGATFAGAIVGAVLIQAAPFMRHNWELILTSGFAYVPAMLWAADRLAVERRVVDGMWLSLACAGCVWVGSPPAMFQAATLTGLYFLFRLGEETRAHGTPVLREVAGPVLLATLLIVGLSGAVVMPGLHLTQHSVQAGRAYDTFVDGSLRPREMAALIWPMEGNHLYVGWFALVMTPFALTRQLDRSAWFFLGMAIVAIGMVMGTHGPLFPIAHAVVPGVSMFRLPHRYEAWWGVAMASLAAFGITRIDRYLEAHPITRPHLLRGVAGVLLAAAVASAIVLSQLTPALLLGAIGVLALGASFKVSSLRAGSAWVGAVVAALVLLDVTQTLPPERHMRSGTPPGDDAIARAMLPLLPDTDRQFRYMDEFTMSCRSGSRCQRRDFRGYQDPLLLASYERVVAQLREHPELAPQFNVRYALQGPHFLHGWDRHYLPPPAELRERLASRVLYEDEEERSITELLDAVPYAYFVADRNVEYLRSRREALNRVMTLAPAAVCVLEGHAPSDRAAGHAAVHALPESVARSLAHSRDRVRFRITARRSGYVVINDAYYPGWTAEVDGERTEVLRANGFVRAVRVSSGEHEIELSFLPDDGVYWRQALLFSAFALFSSLVVLPLIRFSRRRFSRKRRER